MNVVSRNIALDAHRQPAAREYVPSFTAERKWPVRYGSIEALAICADVASILLASIISALLFRIHSSWSAADLGKAIGSAIVVSALLIPLLKMRGSYRPVELLGLRKQIRAVCLAWGFVFILLAAAVGALNIGHELSRTAGLMFAVLGLTTLMIERALIKRLLEKGLSGRRFAGGNIVLITDQPQSKAGGLADALAVLGFSITARFSLHPRFGLSARVIEHIRGSDIEQIVVQADPNRWLELRALVAELRVLPLPVILVPVGAVSEIFRRPTSDLGGAVCVELQRAPLTLFDRASKRFVDVVGAGLTLLVLSPLLATVALAIKLDSPGPVLFRQQRCGFNGRRFAIRKFRTMRVQEDGASVVQAKRDDYRVTRIGKWLRRTSVDELPQLLNVLDGSMSLVGPRPHAMIHDGEFDKGVRNYAFRRRVKPGLTGWAQIHGYRGPTPTSACVERRVEHDLWYIDNWSLRLDLAILLRTPIEVLRGRNAY